MMQQTIGERLFGAVGAAIVVGLMGYLLLFGLPVTVQILHDRAITLVDVPPPPSVRLPRPPPPPPSQTKAKGKPSPANLKNNASAIVAPPPIVPPPPTPVIAALQPGPGTAASSGASDHLGPGEGAGGTGDGTGAGGDDGDGADDSPPRQIGGRLKYPDLPASLRDNGVDGMVSVRYEVEVDGRVGDCVITGSSGNDELDQWTCRLIQERFSYAPSRTPAGEPVSASVEEHYRWTGDRHKSAQPSRRAED